MSDWSHGVLSPDGIFLEGRRIQLGKHWKIVIGALLAITVVLGIGLTQVEFATGQDSYLNPDSQIAIDNVAFHDNFGGETVIMLTDTPGS